MSDAEKLLEVGTIGRAHGTRGEVAVRLITDRVERLEPGSTLSTDQRQLVVATSRPHQDRWLVRFEGISTRSQAQQLQGWTLRAPALTVAGVLWVHELVGSNVDVLVVHPGGVATDIANSAKAPEGISPEEVRLHKKQMNKLLRLPPEKAAETIIKAIIKTIHH